MTGVRIDVLTVPGIFRERLFSLYHDLRLARVRVARLAFADPQPTPIRNALRSALVLNPDGLLARLAELLLALYLAIISPLSPCWR